MSQINKQPVAFLEDNEIRIISETGLDYQQEINQLSNSVSKNKKLSCFLTMGLIGVVALTNDIPMTFDQSLSVAFGFVIASSATLLTFINYLNSSHDLKLINYDFNLTKTKLSSKISDLENIKRFKM